MKEEHILLRAITSFEAGLRNIGRGRLEAREPKVFFYIICWVICGPLNPVIWHQISIFRLEQTGDPASLTSAPFLIGASSFSAALAIYFVSKRFAPDFIEIALRTFYGLLCGIFFWPPLMALFTLGVMKGFEAFSMVLLGAPISFLIGSTFGLFPAIFAAITIRLICFKRTH